jgi:UDP-glucuronate 4-epimerase
MKILITGAGGFIGKNLLEYYQDSEHEIHALDLTLPEDCCGAVRHEDDICTTKVIQLVRPDVIVHLAGLSGVRASDNRPEEYIDINVKGTVHLFQESVKWRVQRIVYASSSSVYGDSPCDESELMGRQRSIYALSKLMTEQVAQYYWTRHRIRSIGLRFFTVYGSHGRMDMALGGFADAMLKGQPIKIFGDGHQKRDYTHVFDIVDAVHHCVMSSKITCNTADVGAGASYSVLDVVDALSAALKTTADIEFHPRHDADVKMTLSDNRELEILTGFKPKISFYCGVSMFVDWLKSQQDGQPDHT